MGGFTGSISKSAHAEFVASYAALRGGEVTGDVPLGTEVYIGAAVAVVRGRLVWNDTTDREWAGWVTVEDSRGYRRSELRSDVFLSFDAAHANLKRKGW